MFESNVKQGISLTKCIKNTNAKAFESNVKQGISLTKQIKSWLSWCSLRVMLNKVYL